jgi:hypothetical protein
MCIKRLFANGQKCVSTGPIMPISVNAAMNAAIGGASWFLLIGISSKRLCAQPILREDAFAFSPWHG